MKTYAEQRKEIEEMIKKSPMLDVVECKEVIAEDETRLLVRSVGAMKMAGRWFPTLNHELWFDKDKYERGIASETKGRRTLIYMMNITGANEEKLIQDFYNLRVCSL